MFSFCQPNTNDNAGLSQVLLSDDGTTQTNMLFGLDLIHQDDGTTTRTMLADGLGSVRTELVGTEIETVTTYEPYGKLLARTGSSGTVFGYTGEQQDATTNLTYLRARYYNPDLKLFMSRDPFPGTLTSPASQHGYSYVHNNPVNHTDPTGEIVPALCVAGPIGAGICLTIGAVAIATGVVAVDALVDTFNSGSAPQFYFTDPPISPITNPYFGSFWQACSSAERYVDKLLNNSIARSQGDNSNSSQNLPLSELGGHSAGSPGDFDPNDEDNSDMNPLDGRKNTVLDKEYRVLRENGDDITDFDSIERTARGDIWLIEEKSATWAQNPQIWAQKHIFRKGQSYIDAIENGTNLNVTSNNIGFRFTHGTVDPTLRTEVQRSVQQLQKLYPNYNFNVYFAGG